MNETQTGISNSSTYLLSHEQNCFVELVSQVFTTLREIVTFDDVVGTKVVVATYVESNEIEVVVVQPMRGLVDMITEVEDISVTDTFQHSDGDSW